MTKLDIANRPNLTFTLAVLILLGVAAVATIELRARFQSEIQINRSLQIADVLEETLALLVGAETGTRGFVVTGENGYLEPYQTAVAPTKGIFPHLQTLRGLMANSTNQQERLNHITTLTQKELGLLDKTISLRRTAGFDLAKQQIQTHEGKTTMDAIRGLIAQMDDEEDMQLQSSLVATSKNARNAFIALIAGLFGSVFLLALAFYIINLEVAERRRAEGELQLLNSELDRRIELRTAQLSTANALIEEQLFRLKALRAIDIAILSTTDLRLSLRVILEQTMSRLQTDAASVLLCSPNSSIMRVAASFGFRTQQVEGFEMRLGEGVAGKAALERRAIAVPNLGETESIEGLHSMVAEEGFRAIYAMPLIVKGVVVGVLDVIFRRPLQLSDDQLEFLDAIAGQAAMAIDSSRSFERLQRSNVELGLAYETTIEGWSRALDLRDKETEGHSQRVTEMTLLLARAAGMSETEQAHIRHGALLHDIGKMGVPDAILLKPGKLTDDEWVIMRKHPTFAYELLYPIVYLRPALDIPYCHHEKWDGSGYPRGLKGEQIPRAARLFAVVDIWDALRSDRPYRPAWPQEKVVEYIRTQAGSHLESAAVELFIKAVSETQIGPIG